MATRNEGTFPGLPHCFLQKFPWKYRVLARAQIGFAQQDTLEKSNITPPRCPSPSTLTKSHQCIWYRQAKSVAVLLIGYGKSYLLESPAGLDTLPLVFFWLVIVLSNCVRWYFQMHAWRLPSSWAIFITHCQTLQLSTRGNTTKMLSTPHRPEGETQTWKVWRKIKQKHINCTYCLNIWN